ncbi:MAG: ATP-binding protein [Actinobacteria bacterium]|nr:MAG: ATP-binding protein [Actinomycetota bacterium]TMK82925.1 MAG: ATP-binding protein [Actinomycetota bacterium]
MRGPRNTQPAGAHSFELALPPSRRIGSVVRRALEDLDLPQAALEEAQLLASELVSNSIRHAGLSRFDEIKVTCSLSGTTLRVDVFDGSQTPLRPLAGSIRPSPGAESGWGLYLVDHIASRWGSMPGRYWFQLDVSPGRADN